MNFQITQGSGTTIGSDPVSGVNFQEIKLIDSTLGSAAPTGVAANPLQVSLEFTNTNTNPLTISGNVFPAPSYDRATIGLMAAAPDTVIIDCTGISTLGWTTSGNWIGTMTHEVQYGDGQWFIVETIDTNLANDGKPFVLTQWTEGLNGDPWITNVAGATQLRFRFVAYTSGSATITTNGSVGVNAVRVYNLTASIFQTTARLNDGTGNALTSTTIGSQQALDVNIAGGVTIDVNLDHTTDNVLVYGNDGTTDRKILTDATGATQVVGVGNFTVVQPTGTNLHTVVDSGSITVSNATLAVTQSGVWNINNISGTISLPTGASTAALQTTGNTSLSSIDSKTPALGQALAAASVPVVLTVAQLATLTPLSTISVTQGTSPWVVSGTVAGTGNFTVIQPVGTNLHAVIDSGSIAATQSGAWAVGRTWSLASGTDSVTIGSALPAGTNVIGHVIVDSGSITVANATLAVTQSGTWNLNNISGTISLPTGASTSANQTNGNQQTQIVQGGNTLFVGTNGQILVSGKSAVGVLPADNPVSVSGVDGGGLKRAFLTDTSGRQQVDTFDGSGNPISSTQTRSTLRGLNFATLDGPQIDSYGRMRVNQPDIQFSAYFSNSAHALYFNTALTGAGTTSLNTTLGSFRLSTTTASGDQVIVQTKRYLPYLPGCSYFVAMSTILGPQKTNLRKRFGYFDANDGFFFEQTGTDVAVTMRTSTSGSPVDTRFAQSTWNIDKLDGTGFSGVTLDSSKLNLYVVDFLWQGAGRVRFGLINGGSILYFHEILNSNTLSAPFMRSPSRPARIEMTNTGAVASSSNLDVVCAVAIREATNNNFVPEAFGATGARAGLVVAATPLPLISIRPNTTFNGITNRVVIWPQKCDIVTSAQPVIVQILLNATLTGSSFAAANAFSAAQIDTTASAVSAGTILWEGIIASGSTGSIDLTQLVEAAYLGLDIAGATSDTITITAVSTAGNTTTWTGLSWKEFQ